jgi:hypothetical protein
VDLRLLRLIQGTGLLIFSNSFRQNQNRLCEICVFEYDTVIHHRTFVVVLCDVSKLKKLFKDCKITLQQHLEEELNNKLHSPTLGYNEHLKGKIQVQNES